MDLVINLEDNLTFSIIEADQLMFAKKIPVSEIEDVIKTVGDTPIDKLDLVVKPDIREDVSDGKIIDEIVTPDRPIKCLISEHDLEVIRTICVRLNIPKLDVYNMYRYYALLVSDGIFVDTYPADMYLIVSCTKGKITDINVYSQAHLFSFMVKSNSEVVMCSNDIALFNFKNCSDVPRFKQRALLSLGCCKQSYPVCKVVIDGAESLSDSTKVGAEIINDVKQDVVIVPYTRDSFSRMSDDIADIKDKLTNLDMLNSVIKSGNIKINSEKADNLQGISGIKRDVSDKSKLNMEITSENEDIRELFGDKLRISSGDYPPISDKYTGDLGKRETVDMVSESRIKKFLSTLKIRPESVLVRIIYIVTAIIIAFSTFSYFDLSQDVIKYAGFSNSYKTENNILQIDYDYMSSLNLGSYDYASQYKIISDLLDPGSLGGIRFVKDHLEISVLFSNSDSLKLFQDKLSEYYEITTVTKYDQGASNGSNLVQYILLVHKLATQ